MNRRGFIKSAGIAAVAASTVIGSEVQFKTDSFGPIRETLKGKESAVWVFTGDSITHGALHTFGSRSYVEHFAERVRWELRRMNDVVINTGNSGDTIKGILANAEARVFRFAPKIVSLMIGMNDCRDGESGRNQFRDSLEKFVIKANEKNVTVLLHTPNTVYVSGGKERSDLPAYVDVIRQVATKHDLALIDHYAYWTAEATSPAKLQMFLNDGSIHPNGYGHLVLARKLFIDLGIFDPKSTVCRLFVP